MSARLTDLRYIVVQLVFLICAASACAQSDSTYGVFSVRTEAVFSLDKSEEAQRGACSKDGQHFGIVVQKGNKQYLWCDGTKGPKIDAIFPPVFSPDSNRVAYLTFGIGFFIYIDGNKTGPYNWFDYENVSEELVFSPDGRHMAFRAGMNQAGTKYDMFVTLDGVAGARHSAIVGPAPQFSPDSKRLAYFVRDDSEWYAILDDKPGPKFAHTGDLAGFSVDSKRFNYYGLDKDSLCYVVINDTAIGPFYRNLFAKFGPEGHDLYWSAARDSLSKDTVYINDQPIAAHDRAWDVYFRKGSNKAAYLVHDRDSFFVYSDDFTTPKFQDITRFRFSEDGNHYAYIASLWPKGDMQALYLDTMDIGKYPAFTELVISADGTRIAAVAKDESGKYRAYVDGTAEPVHDSVQGLSFSPDSKSVYYRSYDRLGFRVIQDGKAGPYYEKIAPSFCIDSTTNKLIYSAYKGSNTSVVVVDGQETPPFDYWVAPHRLPLHPPVVLYFENAKKEYRLTITATRSAAK